MTSLDQGGSWFVFHVFYLLAPYAPATASDQETLWRVVGGGGHNKMTVQCTAISFLPLGHFRRDERVWQSRMENNNCGGRLFFFFLQFGEGNGGGSEKSNSPQGFSRQRPLIIERTFL